ncbi:MAG TPA: fimbrillin family protein [Candidatus Bacteroides merdigallinarum]|uniref:Fimbrillin family protein n=1 Tax=Candidatus Bacteroides merdigallinarum TaxID=2838473 RepID=A0A9D2EAU2_9BACE|nr:fimbrillin family protein [Candidatus Bacteroides merdigallinarum]
MMRKIKHILPLALLVLAFTACSQEETDALPGSKQPLTLTATIAEGVDTRATVNGEWDGGEQIALQVDAGNYYAYTVDREGNMTGNYYWQDGESVNIQGFCPSSLIDNQMVWTVSITQNNDDDYLNSDLLCSEQKNVTKNIDPGIFNFYHQTAKLVVNVQNGGYLSGGTDNNVSMTIGESDNIKISGTFTPMSIGITGTWNTDSGTTGTITPHTAATTSGYVATFEALVIPQTVSTGTLFQFYVGDVGPFRYEVPAGGSTWNAGTEYTYNVTLKAENKTVTVNSISAGGWGNGGSHDLETE